MWLERDAWCIGWTRSYLSIARSRCRRWWRIWVREVRIRWSWESSAMIWARSTSWVGRESRVDCDAETTDPAMYTDDDRVTTRKSAATYRLRCDDILIITARCYASAVLAVGLCPCLCLSEVGVLWKRLDESSWFLASEIPSIRPTLY